MGIEQGLPICEFKYRTTLAGERLPENKMEIFKSI